MKKRIFRKILYVLLSAASFAGIVLHTIGYYNISTETTRLMRTARHFLVQNAEQIPESIYAFLITHIGWISVSFEHLLWIHGFFLLLLYVELFILPRQSPAQPSAEQHAYRTEETEEIDPLTETYMRGIYSETRKILLPPPADSSQDKVSVQDAQQEQAEEKQEPDRKILPFAANKNNFVEMDLLLAIKEAIDSLSSFTQKQHIQIHLSANYEILPICADPDSIRTLFRNIIDNSIKYMGRAGHLLITLSQLGDDIFIILKDTGNGLSPEETEHVFELNFQGSNRVSGNGLGLTQAKQIVESIGGTIYAKSNINNGMAIYIQLPSAKHR